MNTIRSMINDKDKINNCFLSNCYKLRSLRSLYISLRSRRCLLSAGSNVILITTDKNRHVSARRNRKLGKTFYEVPTSEISCDYLSAIRSPEFPCRSSPVGRSVGRSVPVKLRGGESCSRPVLRFFIGNYLFLHPSPFIRMAEIKRQINVSEQMDRRYERKIRY